MLVEVPRLDLDSELGPDATPIPPLVKNRSYDAILDAVTRQKMKEYGTCTEDCTYSHEENPKYPGILHFQTEFSIIKGGVQRLQVDGGTSMPQTFEELDQKGAELLSSYIGLRELVLQQNGMRSLSLMPRFQLLELLVVSRNKLTTLQGLVHMPKLQVLDLSRNRICNLRHLPVFHNLQRLDLSFNWLDDRKDSPKLIKILDRCYNLKHLNLAYNPLNDPQSLMHIAHLPKLQSLNVTGCPLVLRLNNHEVYKTLQQNAIAVVHGLNMEDWNKYTTNVPRCK